jgi:predicted metallo-beta-lactamase superfamily hydrolase
MVIDLSSVEHAIREVREILQLDGADLLLAHTGERDLDFQLVLESASCKECVMPRAYLEKLTLVKVQEVLPQVATVRIQDPREHGESAEEAK